MLGATRTVQAGVQVQTACPGAIIAKLSPGMASDPYQFAMQAKAARSSTVGPRLSAR